MSRRRPPYTQARFGPRGQSLWDAMSDSLNRAHLVLLDEACRMADRLDKLDRIATGDVEIWARLRDARNSDERAELVIDSALSEARMTATALRQIIHEITGDESAAATTTSGGSALDVLAERRRARQAAERGATPAV